jgi:hypothetical protein
MKKSNFLSRNNYKPMISTLVMVIFMVFAKSLAAQVTEEYFDVIYSKCDSWAGGPVGSGSGVNYTFTIKFKKKVDICFDTIWIGDKPTRLTNNNSQKIKHTNYSIGDSIVVYAAIYYPVKLLDYYLKQTENIPDEKTFKNPMPEYKCEALFQFYANDKVYYYGLKKFDVVTFIAYP